MHLINFKWLFIWFLIVPKTLTENNNVKISKPNVESNNKFDVHFMEVNTTYIFRPLKRGFFEKHFNTYCYRGEPNSLGRLLESIELQLEIENDDYIQYEGVTPAEVEEHYNQHRSIFSLNLFTQKRSRLSLSPFVQQCIGIETVKPYNVTLHQEKVDIYRSLQLLTGIAIFMFAGVLSTNSLFYYIMGILLGICLSVLLVIWLSGKCMPTRTMMYGVLVGGWTLCVYVIRMLLDNIQMIMLTYRTYVCWYIIITGLVSFFLCYLWGPPKDIRSKNIIKWLLQLLSLVAIYYSSYFKEATMAIMFLTIVSYYFLPVWKTSGNLSTRVRTLENDNNRHSTSLKIKDEKDTVINLRHSSESSIPNQDLASDQQEFKNNEVVDTDSDISLGEEDIKNQKLYPLPDGSFLLSAKRPIIIKPQPITTPEYHRSAPSNDEQGEGGDYTPRNHLVHTPLAARLRRSSAAASISNLLSDADGGHAVQPTQVHNRRSSSAQRAESLSPPPSSKIAKHSGSSPNIGVDHVTSKDEN